MSGEHGAREEMYVGYLPLPRRDRRFLRLLIPAVLWAGAAASALFAWSQRSPGTGVWRVEAPVELHGSLRESPYPLLDVKREDGSVETYLVVRQGKLGAGSHPEFRGGAARVRGYLLERAGNRMIELAAGDAITIFPHPPDPPPVEESLGFSNLHGEIVDSKCFLGAMKPGDGLTHRACATVCIDGGIPPVLAVRDPGGGLHGYLLTDASGGPAPGWIRPLIGKMVVLKGEVVRRGTLMILRLPEAAPDSP